VASIGCQWCSGIYRHIRRGNCDDCDVARWPEARQGICILYDIHALWNSPSYDLGSVRLHHSFPRSQSEPQEHLPGTTLLRHQIWLMFLFSLYAPVTWANIWYVPANLSKVTHWQCTVRFSRDATTEHEGTMKHVLEKHWIQAYSHWFALSCSEEPFVVSAEMELSLILISWVQY
jgi:hypothetical protein